MLWLAGPRAPAQQLVALRLSCPRTQGISFPGPEMSLCPLYRQAGRRICTGRGSLNLWTTREVLGIFFV